MRKKDGICLHCGMRRRAQAAVGQKMKITESEKFSAKSAAKFVSKNSIGACKVDGGEGRKKRKEEEGEGEGDDDEGGG